MRFALLGFTFFTVIFVALFTEEALGKTPHKPVPATPAPAVAPQESVPMARQRTVAEDEQLKAWIIDIQNTAQEQMKRADEAEAEAKSSRDHSAIAEQKANEAEMRLADVQTKFNAAEDERDKAIAERDVEHKGRVAAEANVSKIKTYLGFALGGLMAFAAFYLLSQFPLPPPLGLYVRIGGPVIAFGLGYLIVARFV
jgi:hypothetical protein